MNTNLYEVLKNAGSTKTEDLISIAASYGFSKDDAKIGSPLMGIIGAAIKANKPGANKKSNAHQLPLGKKPSAETVNLTSLYRDWCAKNDIVTGDKELAHFTGKTYQAFYAARKRAEEDGYEFEALENGYKITARPYDKNAQRINELKAALDKISKELDELSK